MPTSQKPRHLQRAHRAALNPILRNAIDSLTADEWGRIALTIAESDDTSLKRVLLGVFAQYRGLTNPRDIAESIAARKTLFDAARDTSSAPDGPDEAA